MYVRWQAPSRESVSSFFSGINSGRSTGQAELHHGPVLPAASDERRTIEKHDAQGPRLSVRESIVRDEERALGWVSLARLGRPGALRSQSNTDRVGRRLVSSGGEPVFFSGVVRLREAITDRLHSSPGHRLLLRLFSGDGAGQEGADVDARVPRQFVCGGRGMRRVGVFVGWGRLFDHKSSGGEGGLILYVLILGDGVS